MKVVDGAAAEHAADACDAGEGRCRVVINEREVAVPNVGVAGVIGAKSGVGLPGAARTAGDDTWTLAGLISHTSHDTAHQWEARENAGSPSSRCRSPQHQVGQHNAPPHRGSEAEVEVLHESEKCCQ